MTDYIDGELDRPLVKEVDQHLEGCSECRALKEELKTAAINPLEGSEKLVPPDSIWHNVKERIEEKASAKSLAGNIIYDIAILLRKQKAAFAFATAAAIMLVIVAIMHAPVNGHKELNAYLDEQGSFLSHLSNGENQDAQTEVADFGTGIEEYFL